MFLGSEPHPELKTNLDKIQMLQTKGHMHADASVIFQITSAFIPRGLDYN